jgi:hypothetical protein
MFGAGSRVSVMMTLVLLGGGVSTSVASGAFIENCGQQPEAVRYYCPGSSVDVFFTDRAVVLGLHQRVRLSEAKGPSPAKGAPELGGREGWALYLTFNGSDPSMAVTARSELAGRHNYFIGDDPALWRTAVPRFQEVVYRNLRPGIDLVYRLVPEGLEYEIIGSRDAGDLARQASFEGAASVVTTEGGALRIETPSGVIVDARPSGEETIGVVRFPDAPAPPPASHRTCEGRDDPARLEFSTYLGGSGGDYCYGVVLDPAGNPIVEGLAANGTFPTTPGAYDTSANGAWDVFVSKFDPTASQLLWSTFIGGSGDDFARAMAYAPSGDVVLTGETESADFPTTAGAYDRSFNGGTLDLFLARLNDSGNILIGSTYLGGSDWDRGYGVTTDHDGNAVATGYTRSADFPTTPNAYDRTYNGGDDVLVAKFDSACGLFWSTYIGGTSGDRGYAVVTDPQGCPVVAGAAAVGYPTTVGAYDQTFNGGEADDFVTKLNATGSALLWSTFLGGSSAEHGSQGLVLDALNNPIITGVSASSDFPTSPGAYDRTNNGGYDATVSKLDASGSTLLWGTFLGGSGADIGYAVAMDAERNVVVVGNTGSPSFPTTPNAYDTSLSGGSDAFVTCLNASGDSLIWSSFLGGAGDDYAFDLVFDSVARAVVSGITLSSDFPTTAGAYDRSYNGSYDAFLSGLRVVPVLDDVEEGHAPGISPLTLAQNEPNPFTRGTLIRYVLPRGTWTSLEVFDLTGRKVADLVHQFQPAGSHELLWSGDKLGSGVYYCRLQAANAVLERTLIITR